MTASEYSGITAIIPWAAQDALKAWVEYEGPLEAPIAAGDTVAQLVLAVPGIGETRYPLQAMAPVNEGGFLRRLEAAASILAERARDAAFGGDS